MVLTCDACENSGLELPEISANTKNELRNMLPDYASAGNPTDVAADAPLDRYNGALSAFCQDENLDAIIVVLEGLTCGDGILDQDKWPETLGATLKACGKPSLVLWMFAQNRIKQGIHNFEKFGIPVYASPERIARAMKALCTYGAYLQDAGQRN
jgi:acyl-CoA synthetase (NDP forming)